MKEFEYKSDENAVGTVPCQYMPDIFIGSVACWNCEFFKRIDMKNRKVYCMCESYMGQENKQEMINE